MVFPHRLVLHRPVMQHDAHLGHSFVPNVRVRICHERGSYVLRTNGQGYRSDTDFGPNSERPRIVLYGDSFAAGDGVSNGERFSDILAARLGAEIINLAVSGTAPDQNVLLAESQPKAARDADLVLWCVATHAIDRIKMRYRTTFDAEGKLSRVARPYFEWENGALVPRGIPVPDLREPLELEATAVLDLGTARMVRLAREGVRDWILEPMRTLTRIAIGPPKDERFTRPNSDSWRMMVALVRRFRAAIGEVPLVIVPLPNRHHLEGRLRPTYRSRFNGLLDEAGLRTAAGSGAIPATSVVDVLPSIRASLPKERGALCYSFDGHYTPAGHAAMADAIAMSPLPGIAPNQAALGRAARIQGGGPNDHEGQRTNLHQLEIEWDHAGSRAKLIRLSDNAVVAAADEEEVAGRLGMLGAVPFTAINVCLDRAMVRDEDLERILLRSPGAPKDLRGGPTEKRAWAEWAAPWIRWIGAAEMDVRALLAFDGPVEIRTDGVRHAPADASSQSSDAGSTDDEARWLLRELQHKRAAIQGPGSLRGVAKLASKWERATRRARYAALPLPLP